MPANLILATILQLLVQYRQARDKQKALTPKTGQADDPNTPEREDFLTNQQIIELLRGDAQALQARAADLLAKYAPADGSDSVEPTD